MNQNGQSSLEKLPEKTTIYDHFTTMWVKFRLKTTIFVKMIGRKMVAGPPPNSNSN